MAGNRNLIVNGDFSRGHRQFSSDYSYTNPHPHHQTGQGDISIVTDPGTQFANNYDSYGDHTSGSGDMLLVDGKSSGAFWSQGVSLAADTTYVFTYFVSGADSTSPAEVALTLNGSTVDGGFAVTGVGGRSQWQRVTAAFTTTQAGTFTLALSDLNGTALGNDFTIDDISLRRSPVALPRADNLVRNGDFTKGAKSFSSDYQYIAPGSGASTVDEYSVISNPGVDFTNGYDHYGDHTSGSDKMLFVDGASSGAFWRETLTLSANTTYQFSYYVTGADNSNLPSLKLALNGSTVDTGFQVSADGGGVHWQQVVESFTTTTAGAYVLALSDNVGSSLGNDFTIDDIRLAAAASPAALIPPAAADGSGRAHVTTTVHGHEKFAYRSVADSPASAPQTIAHLVDGDVIKLSGIDADVGTKGHQHFTLVTALDGHAGEAALSYDSAHDQTRLMLDVDGDGKADMMIAIAGDHRDFHHFVF